MSAPNALHDIKHWSPRVVQQPRDPMLARAKLNYPDSEFNQAAWLRAVAVVRKTRIGWHLDKPITRGQANA